MSESVLQSQSSISSSLIKTQDLRKNATLINLNEICGTALEQETKTKFKSQGIKLVAMERGAEEILTLLAETTEKLRPIVPNLNDFEQSRKMFYFTPAVANGKLV